jgi:hypothetical protein
MTTPTEKPKRSTGKKIRRTIGLLLLLSLLGGALFIGYQLFFAPLKMRDMWEFVPEESVYVLEADEPIEDWKAFSKTAVWRHLKRNDYMADIGKDADYLDSLIQADEKLFALMDGKPLLLCALNKEPDDYDFLYLIDLEKGARIAFFKDVFEGILDQLNYPTTEEEYKGHEVLAIHYEVGEDPIYLAFQDNILLVSYTKEMVGAALSQSNEPFYTHEENFLTVKGDIKGKGLFQIYANYSQLDEHMRAYMTDIPPLVKDLSEMLRFSAADVTFSDQYIELMGSTKVNDSIPSILNTTIQEKVELETWKFNEKGKKEGRQKTTFRTNVKPTELHAPEILPGNTSFFLSINMDKPKHFYGKVLANMVKDEKEYTDFMETKDRAESYLRVNLEDHFISWMKDEVVVSMLPLSEDKTTQAYLAFFKTSDSTEAASQLEYVSDQIRKKTPVKFKSYDHRGYEINYLEMKGLFKVFFGKLFKKFEKPHYVKVGEYVVFSNDTLALHTVVDNHLDGQTLIKQEGADDFFDKFNSTSNYFIYLNGDNLYPWVPSLADLETRKSIKKNEEYITCFRHWGIQLTEDDGAYDTRLFINFRK